MIVHAGSIARKLDGFTANAILDLYHLVSHSACITFHTEAWHAAILLIMLLDVFDIAKRGSA